MTASVTALVLVLVGLIFVGVFIIIYCANCNNETTIMQYLILFLGFLFILVGFLVFTASKDSTYITQKFKRIA